MKFLESHHQRKAGHTLLVTLVTLGIIGLVLISYLRLSANQSQLITRSQVWNACMALAEAGIEEALNHSVYNETNMVSNDWKLQANRYSLTNTLGEGRYVVSISQTWPREIISQGFYPMPVAGRFLSRRVRVTTTNLNVFFAGLVVRSSVELNGNNVLIDSYNSRDPLKSTNGRYDPLKAGDRGDVVCADGIKDSLYVGNADIYGRVFTGPTASVRVGPQGGVGTHAWRNAGHRGEVQPGYWIKDFNMSFPDVTMPYTTAPAPQGGVYNGTTYGTVLGTGNWMTTRLSGNTIVTGNATILVTDRIDYQNGSLEIAPGASLKIYMAGQTTLIGTTINGNSSATNLYYYGLPSNKQIDIKTGGAAFTAAIYAPNAELFINGSNQLFGGAVVNSARLVGNCQLHFDEALAEGPKRGLVITSWEEL
jgi:hypothetical protein